MGAARRRHHLSAKRSRTSFRRLIAEAFAASAIAVVVAIGPTASAALAGPWPTPAPSVAPATAECVVCHGDRQILAAAGEDRPELVVTLAEIRASVHGSFTCTTCHSSLTATMHARQDIARRSCAGCHAEEAELLARGKHGSPQARPALTCVACHGNHGVLDTHSPAFRLRMTKECASCHDEMSRRFYGGNPFGMEIHLGRSDVATCWDCHGSHLVLDSSDPRSPVNPANLLATCRKCHENAPPNFADIRVHFSSSPLPEDPRLRAVTLYMLFILVFTFGFFGYHTYLQIRHERRRRAAWRASQGGA